MTNSNLPTPIDGDYIPAAVPQGGAIAVMSEQSSADIMHDLLFKGLAPASVRAYRIALKAFAVYAVGNDADPMGAIEYLLSVKRGPCWRLLELWKLDMLDEGLSPKTINLRLSAIRKLTAAGYKAELIDYLVMVDGVKDDGTTVRDTSAPEVRTINRMAEVAREQGEARAARDTALIALLFSSALRRGEIAGIRLRDLDLQEQKPSIAIKGKARKNRERILISLQTRQALLAWLEHRGEGDADDPVFTRLGNQGSDGSEALGGGGIYWVCRVLSKRIGCHVRPHGFRRAAITQLVENGVPVRDIQKLSRHKSMDMVARYDKTGDKVQGHLAGTLGAMLQLAA